LVQESQEEKINFIFPTKNPRKIALSWVICTALLSADFEHFGATCWTYSFNGWFAIFHGNSFEFGDLFFSSTFYTIDLHLLGSPPFFLLVP